MPEDWFRKTSWTESDREDFFTRLKRSRKGSRSQYLRIQALHLAEAGRPDTTEAALSLLEILFDEYPERTEMASAYLQKAQCLVTLNRIDEAIEFFKKSIDFQRGFPNVRNYAHTEYGLLAIRLRLKEEYPSVLATLTEFERDDVSEFPAHLFEVAVIRAVIWSELGNLELAKKFANQALIEAAKTHSGFRYHAKLGLVDTSDAELRRLVEHVAGQ